MHLDPLDKVENNKFKEERMKLPDSIATITDNTITYWNLNILHLCSAINKLEQMLDRISALPARNSRLCCSSFPLGLLLTGWGYM